MIVGLMRMPAGTGARAAFASERAMDLHPGGHLPGEDRRPGGRGQARLGGLRAVERRAFRRRDARGRRGVLHRQGRLAQPARHQGGLSRLGSDQIARLRSPVASGRTWSTIVGKPPIEVGAAPTTVPRRNMTRIGCVLASLALVAGTVTASAQDKYPSKPVKIVVPYAPGGATDITSRCSASRCARILGQQFVVENKPGAFGILAIEEMARSRPDGYTLFVGNVSTNAITPVLFQKKFAINFERDVVSVSRLAIYPSLPASPPRRISTPRRVPDVIALAKKNPGKVRYTSAGRRQLPAFRHGDLRPARRRRDDPYPEQDRRRRHDQRSRRRRRAGRVPQRRELGGDDQGRQAATGRGAGRAAAGGLSGRSDLGGGRFSRRRHPALAEHAGAGQDAEGDAGDAATRRSSTRPRCRSCRRPSPSSWSASSRASRWTRRRPG